MKYIDFWQKKHAQLVIEIFVSLFEDIANNTENNSSSDEENSDEENFNDCRVTAECLQSVPEKSDNIEINLLL